MIWMISDRFDVNALPLADRHYNRRKVGSPQFVPPGRCVVLLTDAALWVTSWPFAEYVRHAWPGAWVNSVFRREGGETVASAMIRQAIAATRYEFGEPPEYGMVTFIDPRHVRRKRDYGRCYRKAGFQKARCYAHFPHSVIGCAACAGLTKAGLVALQLLPENMPTAEQPNGTTANFWRRPFEGADHGE